ncbi:spermatogenesis-associated serine-rich protein 1 [Pelodytes ibericus]
MAQSASEQKDCKALLKQDCNPTSSIQSQEWCHKPDEECVQGIHLPPIYYSVSMQPNCDLDWKPTAQWLPSPRYSDAPFPHIKDCKFPAFIRLQRSYPRSLRDIGAEWSFYPNQGFPYTYHTGKRCAFQGIHLANKTTVDTKTLQACMGTKKKVIDTRNGILVSQPGDKSYRIPEYSPDFHKFGSTRPVVNFKDSYKMRTETFIPLQMLHKTPCVPYKIKEQHQILKEEEKEVEELNEWKPARRSFIFEVPSVGQKP